MTIFPLSHGFHSIELKSRNFVTLQGKDNGFIQRGTAREKEGAEMGKRGHLEVECADTRTRRRPTRTPTRQGASCQQHGARTALPHARLS